MGEINYASIKIPENKDPKKYNYIERRAEILKLVEQAGHPKLINQTELAKRYGVSQQQISLDIQAIKKSLRKALKSEIFLINHTIYTKTLKTLVKENKLVEACKILKEWNEWLFNTGIEEKAPQRIETTISSYIPTPEEVLKKIKEEDGK